MFFLRKEFKISIVFVDVTLECACCAQCPLCEKSEIKSRAMPVLSSIQKYAVNDKAEGGGEEKKAFFVCSLEQVGVQGQSRRRFRGYNHVGGTRRLSQKRRSVRRKHADTRMANKHKHTGTTTKRRALRTWVELPADGEDSALASSSDVGVARRGKVGGVRGGRSSSSRRRRSNVGSTSCPRELPEGSTAAPRCLFSSRKHFISQI